MFYNNNNNKIPKAILLFGLAITLTGLTFKLNHLMFAHAIFNVGVGLLVLGLALWAYILIK